MTAVSVPINELPEAFFSPGISKDNFKDSFLDTATPIETIKGLKLNAGDKNAVRRQIHIRIGERFACNMRLDLHTDEAKVDVGPHTSGSYIVKMWLAAALTIGERTSSNHTEIWIDAGGQVRIGKDCMLAHNVVIMGGDMHGIFDVETLEKLNSDPANISIGDHVWLGRDSLVLKSGSIGDGSILAAKSVLTKTVDRVSLAAGVPAKVIRKNVSWTRSPKFEAMENIARRLGYSGVAQTLDPVDDEGMAR